MRRRRLVLPALAGLVLVCGMWLFGAFSGAIAGAQTAPTPIPSALSQTDTGTSDTTDTTVDDDGDVKLDLDLGSIGEEPAAGEKPSRSIVILLGLTVVSVLGVVLSALGAVLLNLVLALNHRPGRYTGI